MKALRALFLASTVALVCPAAEPELITEVRTKETSVRAYLCLKKEVKLAEMHEFAVEAVTELVRRATDLKLGQGGPIMFTYFNFRGDPNEKFTAEIGLPVTRKTLS